MPFIAAVCITAREPTNVLDLGGNVGATAAYFGMRYPAASVVAVEPNKGNFHLATLNTFRQV